MLFISIGALIIWNFVIFNFRLIRQLWYFSVVAEEQHFRRAAIRLGISQPPLTQHIQVLEKALNLKLFDRSHRQTTLTPQGAAILPAVRRLIDQGERLELAVSEAHRGWMEQVTIGAVTSAILHVLPQAITDAKRLYPKSQIKVKEMNSASAWEALEHNEIELAIGRYSGPKDGIKVQQLINDQLSVALPLNHHLLEKNVVDITDLADEDWIHFPRRANPPNFDKIIAACQKNNFSPRLIHEVTSQLSQIAFVVCGCGIALIPHKLAQFYPDIVMFRPLNPCIEIVTAAAAWTVETPLIQSIVSLASQQETDVSPA